MPNGIRVRSGYTRLCCSCTTHMCCKYKLMHGRVHHIQFIDRGLEGLLEIISGSKAEANYRGESPKKTKVNKLDMVDPTMH